MSEKNRNYTIQSVHYALCVLNSFLEPEHDVQGVSAISQKLGLNKSRVYRILSTLEQHGYVEQDPDTRSYRLGLALLAFSQVQGTRLRILDVASPFLDELARQTGETIHLGVIRNCEAVCIAKRESRHSVRLFAQVGRRSPLHVGGIPKVLLAYAPPDLQATYAHQDTLARLTDQSITEPQELRQVLEQIRRDGYHVAVGDLDKDVHSIAAPIYDFSGDVVAGISVAGPSQRFSPSQIERYVSLVCQAAQAISKRLGHQQAQ